jgi:hypothetical protein
MQHRRESAGIYRASELRKNAIARSILYAAPVFPNDPVEDRDLVGNEPSMLDGSSRLSPLSKLLQQLLRFLQIARLEALGESA